MSHSKSQLRKKNYFTYAAHRFLMDSGLPGREFADGLEISATEYMKFIRSINSSDPKEKIYPLRFQQITNLATKYGISPESLLKRSYDQKLIQKRIHGDHLALPEKYSQNGYSKVRSSAHILELLRYDIGRGRVNELLLKLSVNPCYFDNLDNDINLTFFNDLMVELRKLGINDNALKNFARYLPIANKDTQNSEMMNGVDNYRDFFELLFKNMAFIERNFDYQNFNTKDGIVVRIKPSEQLLSGFDGKFPQSSEMEDYRRYAVSSVPLMANLLPTELIEVRSLCKGDEYTEYFIPVKEEKAQTIDRPSFIHSV